MPVSGDKTLLSGDSLCEIPEDSYTESFLDNYSFRLQLDLGVAGVSPYMSIISTDTGETLGKVRLLQVSENKILLSTGFRNSCRELTLKKGTPRGSDNASDFLRGASLLLDNKENIYAAVKDLIPEAKKEHEENEALYRQSLHVGESI